jgi:precorrin-6B methylase 2
MMFVMAIVLAHGTAFAQATATKPFEPTVGQAGKDVVWVPTPQALVEKMLDLAKLTPQDFHMDLGSGDGRTVITAAKRGARSEGIEYNPDMVALSQRNAKEAGVADRAIFRKADIFETDFSKAQVITLFLLPQLNLKLRPAILNMRPGTRIVSNTFTMDDWQADQTETVGGDCVSWCTAHLWIVPAKVQGAWDVRGRGTLTLSQNFQMLSGTLASAQVSDGKLRGDEITFKAGGTTYSGKVEGNTMSLTANGNKLTATRK